MKGKNGQKLRERSKQNTEADRQNRQKHRLIMTVKAIIIHLSPLYSFILLTTFTKTHPSLHSSLHSFLTTTFHYNILIPLSCLKSSITTFTTHHKPSITASSLTTALPLHQIDATNPDWSSNGAGLHHSHQHGFGLMDAAAMVSSAAVWESVPFSTTYSTKLMVEDVPIPAERMQGVTVRHEVDHATLSSYALTTLEFVQVKEGFMCVLVFFFYFFFICHLLCLFYVVVMFLCPDLFFISLLGYFVIIYFVIIVSLVLFSFFV